MNTLPESNASKASQILSDLVEYAEKAQGAYSKNTDAARTKDLEFYAEFCATRNEPAFPATGKQIAAYIEWMADVKGWKLATIRRRLSTVSTFHRAANLNDPSRDGLHVELALKKVRQKVTEPQKQAPPLQYKDLTKIVKKIENHEKDPMLLARDKAIFLLGYDTMLRQSELANVKADQFKYSEEGFYLDVPFSKTNRGQRTDHRFVSKQTMMAINSMMAAIAPLPDGRVFRKIHYGKPADAMLGADFYYVFRKRSEGKFSGHSLRVGHAIDQRAAGLSVMEICQSGGWNGVNMPMRYTASIDVAESGAAKLAKRRRRD